MTDGRFQDRYQTPPDLIRAVNRAFGLSFDLDVAADSTNAVCREYLSGPHVPGAECWCGLCAPWRGTVWCNPPYSNVSPWVAKAVAEFRSTPTTTVAMLVLADTSTRWFAAAANTAETYLLTPGRVAFIDPRTGAPAPGNRIGSALFIWRSASVQRAGQIAMWDWRRFEGLGPEDDLIEAVRN